MKVLDLFSGIGGFSLGLERAGMETIAFCEIDPFCRKVLKKHWPDIPIFEDVTKLRGNDIEPVDLICGGYPCQPFSLAGKRAGADDDRHLWPEVFRLLQELRPTWFIGENVAGHITMGLDEVLSDLESIGYTRQPFVIPACGVDAPHRRNRVWIIAHTECNGRDAWSKQTGWQKRNETDRPCGNIQPSLANTSGQRLQKQFNVNSSPCRGQKTRYFTGSSESTRRQWEPEPAMGRVAHGIPRRVDRLRALGNAVVPQIPEMIGRAILELVANRQKR